MKGFLIILFIFIGWILLMVAWGDTKDFKPNLNNTIPNENCVTAGHPLWTDC